MSLDFVKGHISFFLALMKTSARGHRGKGSIRCKFLGEDLQNSGSIDENSEYKRGDASALHSSPLKPTPNLSLKHILIVCTSKIYWTSRIRITSEHIPKFC